MRDFVAMSLATNPVDSLYFTLLPGNDENGDGFARDCLLHQRVQCELDFLGAFSWARDRPGRVLWPCLEKCKAIHLCKLPYIPR